MNDEQRIKQIIERRRELGEVGYSDFKWLIEQSEITSHLVNQVKQLENRNAEINQKWSLLYDETKRESEELEKQLHERDKALNEIRDLVFNTYLPGKFINQVVKIVEIALKEPHK